jgi:hypothetical protein
VSGLTPDETAAAVAALYAYRSETTHYLSGYERDSSGHDDCCPTARAFAARRAAERAALNDRLRVIDSALMTLDPDWGAR